MKYKVRLDNIKSIDEIPDRWTRDDFIQLLEVYELGDPGEASDDEVRELLFMAIKEYDPQEAAALLLQFRLGNQLNDGQIEQISNDMLKENVAEHYSDISFHARLFDINVLLYKAYNGKFPHAKASVIHLDIQPHHDSSVVIDEAIALRAVAPLIDEHATFKRLFKDQLVGEKAFEEASDIIWYFRALDNHQYELITSDYWINKADFTTDEADVNVSVED
ncbi:hypothetical protein [Nonlabens xiamenensis]|uniref:hypothetical protein n=1 Tax=Nonlabens xiamenensis TaxID=2341043 RepID=UPI000F60875B|nr:hypothetical protein [Nonlabens xiamenensis]